MSRIDTVISEVRSITEEAREIRISKTTWPNGSNKFFKISSRIVYKDKGMGSLQDLKKMGLPDGAVFGPDQVPSYDKPVVTVGMGDKVLPNGRMKVVWGVTKKGGKDQLIILDIPTYKIGIDFPYVHSDDWPKSV